VTLKRALVLLLAVIGCGLVAQAQTSRNATFEQAIVVESPGPHRLALSPQLLAAGSPFRVVRRGDAFYAEGGLADLRLFAGDRPVPYLLVQPPSGEREWVRGTLLAVAPTKKTSGFEVDLEAGQPIDMIRVDGLPVPHLKRLALEGSGDRQRWTMLVAEGTLFDLPDERLRQNILEFAPGPYRYLRVTWNDANSGRVPAPARVEARKATPAPRPPEIVISAAAERRPSEPGTSRFRIVLPAPSLPVVALDLNVDAGHVYRDAVVTESRFSGVEAAPVELGRAMLSRVTRDGITAAALRVPIAVPAESELELTIDDGENPPLEVRHVELVLAQLPWIYFEAPAGPIVARYGNRSLTRPVYDLEAARGSIDLAKVPEARWADSTPVAQPVEAAAAPAAPAPGAPLDPGAFRYVRNVEAMQPGLVALPLDAHALAFSRGPAGRFADVRVLDASARQVPYLLERRNEPLSIDLTIAPASDIRAPELQKNNGGRQRTVYALDLPHASLPPATLVIETRGRLFQRSVSVGIERPADRHRRDPWYDVIATATWRHSSDSQAARPLTLPIQSLADTSLRVVIDEGDNAPLPVSAVRLLLPSYRVRFYQPAGSSLRLLYGRDDLQAPQYDLALLATSVMGAPAAEARMSAAAGRASAADAIVSPRTFWIVLSGAVLVLLALIVRLIRSSTTPPQP
jgi:uncharacterized protein DUF3999